MKQCPKCNFTCTDDDIICKNCGYLFTPDGLGSDEPPFGSINNQNGMPSQDSSNNPYGTPTQNNPGNPYGTPTQSNSNNPYGTSPQNNSNNPYGTPPQNNFNNPNGMPPQGSSNSWQNQSFNNQNPVYTEPATNGLSIASLVLGIIGVVFSCCYAFGIIPSIVSLVLGIISTKHIKSTGNAQKGSGMSLAGIILASIGILISICVIILMVRVATDPDLMNRFNEIYRQYNETSSSPF